MQHGKKADKKWDGDENRNTAAQGINFIFLKQLEGFRLNFLRIIFILFPHGLHERIQFCHPLRGFRGGEGEGEEKSFEEQRGDNDGPTPIRYEGVDPSHNR